jgi:hypothetical protein
MNRHPLPNDDSRESDAVWKLLEQAPSRAAGPRFADDTVRAARLAGQAGGAWWQFLLRPLPLASGAAAAAALAFAVISLRDAAPTDRQLPGETVAAPQDFSADQQAVVEEEVLYAAVDNLDAFTDSELVCLIGL